jgi:formyl-CoA transferase
MGGMMSITGLPDGEPGGGPMRAGVAIADLFTGMYTCSAILAALFQRERTGEGAVIDMALFDTQLAVMANQASNALISGKDPPRQGNTHPNIVPYQPFEAADQPIIIAVGNDGQFARLAAICGHPEWIQDERFSSNAARVANRAELVRMIADIILGKNASDWLEQLEDAGIPAGPINTITQALSDVQAQHRRMVRTIAGTPLVGSPVRLDGGQAGSELPPPRLGEHTEEVLAHLGLDRTEIERLKADGVIG